MESAYGALSRAEGMKHACLPNDHLSRKNGLKMTTKTYKGSDAAYPQMVDLPSIAGE